jgi:hypothetical protein
MSAAPPSVTLAEAKALIQCLAAEQSLLLLAPPGVGKSAVVHAAAAECGLPVRSLLGTQVAPEDVSGVPRIAGQRSAFCPPRALLPEDGRPFCLFLDELPAAPPDVQKAFYALLLERRLGEHALPPGTWVVAAGNRADDRALVRPMSSALVNRVFVVPVRVDRLEWLAWAEAAGVRPEVRAFVTLIPQALQRPVPPDPVPFSTPRAWALLSRDFDLAEAAGPVGAGQRRALAFGRLSPADAGLFCALCEEGLAGLRPIAEYLENPGLLPAGETARWFLVSRMRHAVAHDELKPAAGAEPALFHQRVNALLAALPDEFRFALLLDQVGKWAALGATEAMMSTLREVTDL